MAIDLPTLRQRLEVDASALDKIRGGFGKVAAGLGKAVAGGAALAGAAVAGFVASGVKGAINVERGVREVVTLFGETGDAANELSAELTSGLADVSASLGIAQEELTGGLYAAISAGVPKDNVFEFMEVAGKASIAGVTDVETAVDGLTTTINAFGLDASQAEEVADSMFAAVQGGKTTFEELSASLFNVAPAAAGLGVGFDEVNAALATLTASGTPTSVATTQMRAALAELGKETSVAGRNFTEIAGQTFPEFIASGGDLQGALDLMAGAAGGSAVELQNMFGSVEAGAAAAQLGITNAEKFSGELGRQAGAAGAAGDAFDTMNETTGRSLERLRTTFSNLAIEVGSKVLPHLATAAEWIGQRLPQWIEAARPVVERMIEVIGNLGRWIGERLPGWIETARPFVESIIATFQSVIDTVGPIIRQIVERFSAGGDGIAETSGKIGEVIGKVKEVFSSIIEVVQFVVQFVRDLWADYGQQWLDNIKTAFDGIVQAVSGALDIILGIVDVVLGILKGDWSRAWDGIKRIVTGAWNVIKGVVKAAVTGVKNAIGLALAIIRNLFGRTWSSITSGVRGFFSRIVGTFRALPGLLGAAALRARDLVVSGFRAMRDGVIRWAGIMLSWIRGIPRRILSALGNVGRLLWQAGRNIISGLIDGIRSRIAAVRSTISNVASTIRRFLPFSPAKEGPLSGTGSPDRAGAQIATMLAAGIDSQARAAARSAAGLASAVAGNLAVDGSAVGLATASSNLLASRSRPASAVAATPAAGIVQNNQFDVSAFDPAEAARKLGREQAFALRLLPA